MSRLIFFVQEAARAMRRNAAPSLAAVVTTAVTVVLLGVLIPIFQTAQAKSNQVRGELNFQAEVYADATRAEINKTFTELKEVPHVKKVEFISKPEALQELKESLGKEKSNELLSRAEHEPAAGQLPHRPRRRRQPHLGRTRGLPARRKRQVDLPRSSATPSTAPTKRRRSSR